MFSWLPVFILYACSRVFLPFLPGCTDATAFKSWFACTFVSCCPINAQILNYSCSNRSIVLQHHVMSTNITDCLYVLDADKERNRAENYNKWHNEFLFLTANSILVTSNHNSFRVLFDNVASVFYIWKNILIFYHWKWAADGNQHCANCIGALSFPIQLLIKR